MHMNIYICLYLALIMFLIFEFSISCRIKSIPAFNIGGVSWVCFQGYDQQSDGSPGTRTDKKDNNEGCDAHCETHKTDTKEAGQSPVVEKKPLSPEEKGDTCQEDVMPPGEEVSPDQENSSDKNTLSDQDKELIVETHFEPSRNEVFTANYFIQTKKNGERNVRNVPHTTLSSFCGKYLYETKQPSPVATIPTTYKALL